MFFILTSIIFLIIIFVYKRQIKNICLQLEFHKKHNSNIKITHDLYSSEIKELISNLNELIGIKQKQRNEYEEKEQRLKETITGLSHDIRTPLTSLDGYMQLLAECDNDLDRQKYILVIEERIRSLTFLIEELFTYAKMQNREYELKLERTDIHKLLFDTLFSFYDDFTYKGIVPTIQIGESPVYAQCSSDGLKRAFQNIIRNVLEHGIEDLVINLSEQNESIILKFENTYDSLMKIDVARIFDRFYKADNARSRTSTGLGLSIVKEIVERMNGSVTVEIKETVFVIIIVLVK